MQWYAATVCRYKCLQCPETSRFRRGACACVAQPKRAASQYRQRYGAFM